MKRALILLWVVTSPAVVGAQALEGDSRIQTIEWRKNTETEVRTTIGGTVTLVFAPGESVRSVLVGDTGAVDVRVAPQTDSISIFTTRQPADASIKVHTQLRDYQFRLVVGPANDVAYAISFSIAGPSVAPLAQTLPPPEATNLYAIKGQDELRPSKVSDDGVKTYIEWGPDQALPAVFALSSVGEEETVDGYMRGGVMVIDRVYPRLVFRIGKRSAQASRLATAKEDRR